MLPRAKQGSNSAPLRNRAAPRPPAHWHRRSPPVKVVPFARRKIAAKEKPMATLGLVEYQQAGPEVRAVYDDIMATRGTNWINNFWKAIAHDPATLRRTWESLKQIMAPGALDPLTKELLYVAVSVTTN